MKFYTNLSVEKKKVIREKILKIKNSRKEQIKLIEDEIIKPLRDVIYAGESVRMGLTSLEEYVRLNNVAIKRLEAFFKGVQNECKE
jgi:hypothetical protein